MESAVTLTREEASQPDLVERSYRIYLTATEEQKASFSNSKCLFLISVGQHYHEGAKLEAALKIINKHFKEVIILVGDTIQRYTHAVHQNKSPEHLLQFAEDEGSRWLERNGPIINSALTKPHRVNRWDHYRRLPAFDYYFKAVSVASKTDSHYRDAFELDSQEFLTRSSRGDPRLLASNSSDLCIQYLTEECACMCVWAARELCEFATYPYGFNNIFRATYKQYIEVPYGGKVMQELAYGIKRKN